MRSTGRGWAGEVREVGCYRVFAFLSAGADTKANTLGAAAHFSEVTALPLSPSHSFVMPSVV